MEQIVLVSCVELFGAFGASVRRSEASIAPPSAAPDPATMTAAMVTFSGASVRGTLMLLTSFNFVAGCRPASSRTIKLSPAMAGDWIFVRDWTKELVNQLLGRIKSQILAHGLTFDSGAPSALTGAAMIKAAGGQSVTPLRFMSGAERVSVWFDVKLTPDAEAKLMVKSVESNIKEGDVVVF